MKSCCDSPWKRRTARSALNNLSAGGECRRARERQIAAAGRSHVSPWRIGLQGHCELRTSSPRVTRFGTVAGLTLGKMGVIAGNRIGCDSILGSQCSHRVHSLIGIGTLPSALNNGPRAAGSPQTPVSNRYPCARCQSAAKRSNRFPATPTSVGAPAVAA